IRDLIVTGVQTCALPILLLVAAGTVQNLPSRIVEVFDGADAPPSRTFTRIVSLATEENSGIVTAIAYRRPVTAVNDTSEISAYAVSVVVTPVVDPCCTPLPPTLPFGNAARSATRLVTSASACVCVAAALPARS